jgi:hypothetical protein
MKKLMAGLALSVLLFQTACKEEGRLYNLVTGEVTIVTFTWVGSGKGTINAVLASGEKLSGEYLTFVRPPVNWGTIYAAVYGAGSSGGETDRSNQYGTAVVSGDKGFVGDCEYVTRGVVSAHGSGACTDNQGTAYKLMF